jgi:hypothetical protein
MSRLPTTKDCSECGSQKRDTDGVSIFRRLGPVPPSMSRLSHHAERVDLEEEEDKYHRPRWCLIVAEPLELFRLKCADHCYTGDMT